MMFDKFVRRIKASLLGVKGLSLHLFSAPLWLTLPIALLQGRVVKSLMVAVVIAMVTYAGVLTQRYYQSCRDNYLKTGRAFAIQDDRAHALGFVSLAVFILITVAIRRPVLLGLIASAIAGVGYYLRYMIDDSSLAEPLAQEDMVSTDHLNPALREMLNQAYDSIESITNSARYLHANSRDNRLSEKLFQVNQQARAIIRMVHDNPDKIRQARTFLIVYLNELAHVSKRYITQLSMNEHWSHQAEFEHLLNQMLVTFKDQQTMLTKSHQEQLEIRMQVLREQLNSAKAHEQEKS